MTYLDQGYDEFLNKALIPPASKSGEELLNALLTPGIIGIEQLKSTIAGTFTTADGKTITIKSGTVTSIA